MLQRRDTSEYATFLSTLELRPSLLIYITSYIIDDEYIFFFKS